MPIPLFILKRLLYGIPTILVVSMIGFFLMRFDVDLGRYDVPWLDGTTHSVNLHFKNPIDPLAYLKNNPAISPKVYALEKQRLGLDQPIHIQYWRWLSNIFRFDLNALSQGRWSDFFKPNLGKTFNNDDVASLLTQRAGYTLLLNLLVVVFSWLVAVPLGVYAALRWRSAMDRLLTLFSSIGMAAPGFVVAILAGVILVRTGWLPFGGVFSNNFESLNPLEKIGDVVRHLLMPVVVLSFGSVAGIQRQMRGNLLDVLQAEYVRVARAKGLPENKVIYKHAVRTAINPLVTMMGYEFSALLSGSVLVEIVLNYPGLGQLMYQAVLKTDTNLVMTSLMMSCLMLIVGNLLADILLKIVDPRIELN